MGKVTLIAEPSVDVVRKICQNLRARDRQEIFATKWTDDPEEVVAGVIASGAFRWAALVDGEPVALIGARPRWPGVWSMWAFGTDRWPEVVRTLTKHAKRFMMPALMNAGAVRADCHALAEHTDARRWLERLGATAETELAAWGKNGQSFVCYVWTRKQLEG